jgi:hypothetical protein
VVAILFLIGISGYIWFHRNELHSLVDAIRTGRWYWLLIAALAEAAYFLNEGFCFSLALRLTGTQISALSVVPLLLSAQTLSVMVPSEFLADESLFILFARRRGKSPAQVALGVSLAEMAELFSFMAVLIVGFLFLAVYRSVRPFEVAAGYIVSILCLLLVALVVFLLWKPQGIVRILTALQRYWNRFCSITIHSWRLPQAWAEHMNRRLIQGVETASQNPRGLVFLLFVALAGHLIRIACLLVVLQAFGLSIALWKVTTAYAIGTLVWIASPIPGGIGLVEGAYSLVLVSLGVTAGAGAGATLALVYRGITFWLPVGTGIVALRLLARRDATL